MRAEPPPTKAEALFAVRRRRWVAGRAVRRGSRSRRAVRLVLLGLDCTAPVAKRRPVVAASRRRGVHRPGGARLEDPHDVLMGQRHPDWVVQARGLLGGGVNRVMSAVVGSASEGRAQLRDDDLGVVVVQVVQGEPVCSIVADSSKIFRAIAESACGRASATATAVAANRSKRRSAVWVDMAPNVAKPLPPGQPNMAPPSCPTEDVLRCWSD